MSKHHSLLLIFFFISCLLPGVAGAEAKTVRADSKAFILPVLELSVSQQGARELSFGNISPSGLGPAKAPLKTILIEVHCNSGEKYQVTQALNGELENIEGKTIPMDHLKFRTASDKSTGEPVTNLTPVTRGSQTIFTSDETGSSETITALYELTIPPSQAAGDYSALLTYTVSSV